MEIRTVEELVRELSKYSPDMQVLVHIEGIGCGSLPIKEVCYYEPYEGAEGDMKPGFITIDGNPYSKRK